MDGAGASLSYWIVHVMLEAVNKAVEDVVTEVSKQLNDHPHFNDPQANFMPDYQTSIDTAIQSSVQGLVIPIAIGIIFPILIGVFFGIIALLAMISGFVVAAVHKAAALSNTGAAWNSAKRVIRATESDKGMTELYKATVIGDTLGDPLKVRLLILIVRIRVSLI
jgi:Na+/H+-translocating membrane pyrophosphatase